MSRFFHCYSEFVMTFLAKKVQIVLGYVETTKSSQISFAPGHLTRRRGKKERLHVVKRRRWLTIRRYLRRQSRFAIQLRPSGRRQQNDFCSVSNLLQSCPYHLRIPCHRGPKIPHFITPNIPTMGTTLPMPIPAMYNKIRHIFQLLLPLRPCTSLTFIIITILTILRLQHLVIIVLDLKPLMSTFMEDPDSRVTSKTRDLVFISTLVIQGKFVICSIQSRVSQVRLIRL